MGGHHKRSQKAKQRRAAKRRAMLKGCPRCGAAVLKVAGIDTCAEGHRLNLWTPTDWRGADPDQRPREFGRVMPTNGSDDP